jgi:hypothetical protein
VDIGFVVAMTILGTLTLIGILVAVSETRQAVQDVKSNSRGVSDAEFYGQIARDEDEMGLKPWNEGGFRE